MEYSVVVITALIATLIMNFDIIFTPKKNRATPAVFSFRIFLIGVLVFFVSDILWGIIYDAKHVLLTYIDTLVYFLSMAMLVVAWCEYVVHYLESKKGQRILMYVIAMIFVLYFSVVIIINFFNPILFAISEDCVYDPGWARYSFFAMQILLFLITGLYALAAAIKKRHTQKTKRYLAISFSALIMVGTNIAQVFYPLWPFYTIGLFLCLIISRTFLVQEEQYTYRRELEESESREQRTQEELEWSRQLTYHDTLTGVYSRHAYVAEEERFDAIIRDGTAPEFALIVFDLNNLKTINDSFGHEAGDKYIIMSVDLIKNFFPGSKIYRFGGDEFIAILEGEIYQKRGKLLKAFDEKIEENSRTGQPVVATGMSIFFPGKDNTLRAVFIRADKGMYRRKMQLKGIKEEPESD